jgi:cobalt-zinc-cadmium efflux system outer membrane protein
MRCIKFIIYFVLIIYPVFAKAQNYTLNDLQIILLKENPKLKSMTLEVEMARKRIPTSSSLDDPKLKIAINSLPVDTWSFKDEDMTTKEIGISQMFPLGGKLGIKEEIALKEYKYLIERLRKDKAEMLHLLRMNVYEIYYIREALKIIDEIENYLQILVDSEAASAKSGMGNLTNVVKANIELTMLQEEKINLKQKEEELRKKIAYLLAIEDVSLDMNFEFNMEKPLLNEIKEKVLNQNPELKMLHIEKEKSELEVILKKKEFYPDLELSFSYMQRDKSNTGMKRPDMISAMASINIPIWAKNKNIPMIEEMEKKRSMINTLIQDKKNELERKVETIFSFIDRWQNLYNLYVNNIIPQNELAMDTIISRYKVGGVEFMPVIDTIRMLLKYKKEAVMLKKEFLINKSELFSLMGEDTPN